MSNGTRGTGEHLTDEQRAYVRTPHSPNQGNDIDFKLIAEEMEKASCSDLSSFDWEMFEKGSV